MGDGAAREVMRRELGLGGATALGLGSILGTGVFVAIGMSATLAGEWIVAVVLAAAGVATCNALSSAQLAAAYPQSGGTYEYGYRLLSPLAGFSAGWMFLAAKSASAAAAALGAAGYLVQLVPALEMGGGPWLALLLAALVVGVVVAGLRRSNRVNLVLVLGTVAALVAFVLVGLLGGAGGDDPGATHGEGVSPSVPNLLEATALMFVAYTGYGRVATLGEEVRDPRRTIPRAILTTLGVSALLYLGVAWTGVTTVGATKFGAATLGERAPLAVVAESFESGTRWLPTLLAIAAVTAMLGVLLNLILGLSRVLLAMGRRADVPTRLGTLHNGSPRPAILTIGALILTLTLIGDLHLAWSFSAFTVLLYYGLTNLAALRLRPEHRLYHRAWSWLGLTSCAALSCCVDRAGWLTGLTALATGILWHTLTPTRTSNSG